MFLISYSRACQVFIIVLSVLFQKASPLQLAFGRTGLGSGPHPQHRLPWRGEDEPRGGGLPSPPPPQPCSPPRLPRAPLETGGEGGCPHPHLLTPAPLLSPQQALLPSMEGENAELGDAPPRGRTRLLQSQTLPPGKQIPDSNRNRGNQKVPSLTPNSTTRLG